MIYQLISYLKFLTRATNQHGVHSPFVYKLITECFYDRSEYAAYKILADHRSHLFNDLDAIEVLDFGAGSRVFKSNVRKVSAIAKNAGIRKKRQQLLNRLVHYLEPATILELGTSVGLSTMALALGNKEATVTSLEGCPQTSKKAQQYFDRFQMHNIDLHNVEFENYLSNSTEIYDLIFIDGNHSKEKTIAYFNSLRKHVNNNSLIIFDDIYWSKEMTAAWKEIIADDSVTVSIDTFQWGLVFFRKEQKKQHFNVRM
ncbi:MAG: class I SAM-dependent methyltransferase [Bacteroidia bacterium]|nr:class I SAM-dependent methyltransferase [Bacteroidia bacterium]